MQNGSGNSHNHHFVSRNVIRVFQAEPLAWSRLPPFHPHGRVWLGSQIVKPLQHVAQMEESLATASPGSLRVTTRTWAAAIPPGFNSLAK